MKHGDDTDGNWGCKAYNEIPNMEIEHVTRNWLTIQIHMYVYIIYVYIYKELLRVKLT